MKMNQIINQFPRQAHFLLIPLSFFLITACPDPPENTDCDDHQIKVNDTCECEEGYHWNDDETKCLMDTTSHNFVWEIDTLGGYGSYLRDVAIVDENDIWMVGNIETDTATYNAAHWNGVAWEYLQISRPVDFEGIYAFSKNDIWFADGCKIFHHDGTGFRELWMCDYDQFGWGQVISIWGTLSSNMYFVGNNGSIIHYDGSTFTKIESGIEESIIDIWGLDENHIWTVTYKNNENGIVNEVLFYDGNNWSVKFEKTDDNWPPVDYTRPSGTFSSVWAYEDTVYISCAGLYKESISTGEGVLVPLEDMRWELGWGTGNVRGTHYNDIVVTTLFGSEVSHYNGKDWKIYDELLTFDIHGLITSSEIAITSDMIVTVGDDLTTRKAMVYRGYRY